MKSKMIVFYLFIIIISFSYVFADVPQMINYQGKLTSPSGALIDTTVAMTFSIYSNPRNATPHDLGDITPLWTEVHPSVLVQKGYFRVLLGSINPIPYNLFDGAIKYLGIKVNDDPEMIPRQEIVSVPYSYRAASVQSGGIDCSDCDYRFVNAEGPESVISSTDPAFFSKVSGSSPTWMRGIIGYADNKGDRNAYGGWFETSKSGRGWQHYGVVGIGRSNYSDYVMGSYGQASNNSYGESMGGYFFSYEDGTGDHYGVRAEASGNSDASVFGSSGWARNSSSGDAYGGYFSVYHALGTGNQFGIFAVKDTLGTGAAVYSAGDFVASGTKSGVLRTSQGEVLTYSVESPEVWFEDFGEAQLLNGMAHVELDPLFLETVTINSSNPMKVFIQLNDPDCKGTAVIRGTTGFDVVEFQNGTSNASFSYRVVAKRKGYERKRLTQTEVGKNDPNLYPHLWEKMEKKRKQVETQMRVDKNTMIEEQGIKEKVIK